MSLHQPIEMPLDEITVIHPGISVPEYKLRKRLRSARNVASMALATVPESISRNLFILLRDHTDMWCYAPASVAQLGLAVEQAQRLYVAADTSGKLEGIHD